MHCRNDHYHNNYNYCRSAYDQIIYSLTQHTGCLRSEYTARFSKYKELLLQQRIFLGFYFAYRIKCVATPQFIAPSSCRAPAGCLYDR